VLVTEGQVQVDAPHAPATTTGGPVAILSRGERAIVPRSATAGPVIEPVTAEDIARELAWQAPRLQFEETPLAAAVAEFNRLNRHQLELADPSLEALRIGGTFRPDNVEGFVRLLNTALGLEAEPHGPDRTVLHRAP
jgi:transmembrane sensor